MAWLAAVKVRVLARYTRFFCLRLLLTPADCFSPYFLRLYRRRSRLCSYAVHIYCVLERHDLGSTNICLFGRSVFFHHEHTPTRLARHVKREWVRWSIICVCLSLLIDFFFVFLFFSSQKKFLCLRAYISWDHLWSHLGSGVDWIHAMMSTGACFTVKV